MNQLKNKLLRIFSSRFFWLSLFISILVVTIVQMAIYFGCKYDLIPLSLADKFLTRIILTDGIDASQFTWETPFWFEFPFFCSMFFLISSQFLKFKKNNDPEILKPKVGQGIIFFKIFILIFFYYTFLAKDIQARKVLYVTLPSSINDSFVINCPQKTIQLGPAIYHKDPSLCRLCQDREKRCVYSGLDKPRP